MYGFTRSSRALRYEPRYAPTNVVYGGYEQQYGQVTRPGRKPLVTPSSLTLRTMSFQLSLATFTVSRAGIITDDSVEDQLNLLARFAGEVSHIGIDYDDLSHPVLWHINALTQTSTLRSPNGDFLRADISLDLVETVSS